MTEPTQLRPAPSTSLVPMLTELLRRAQAGEFSQIALIYMVANSTDYGTWISDRTGAGSTLTLIGALADLQFTMLVQHNEQATIGDDDHG